VHGSGLVWARAGHGANSSRTQVRIPRTPGTGYSHRRAVVVAGGATVRLGAAVGLVAYHSGSGPIGAIIVGAIASGVAVLAGRLAFTALRSPFIRAVIALVFCNSGRPRGIPCCAWPPSHRCGHQWLAAGNRGHGCNCSRRHGLGTHDALYPARTRTRHRRQLDTACSLDVGAQRRLSPPFVIGRVGFQRRSLTATTRNHGAAVAVLRSNRDGISSGSDTVRDAGVGQPESGHAVAAHLYARVSFPSPDQPGLLCECLEHFPLMLIHNLRVARN
jgi:hypothetical protein